MVPRISTPIHQFIEQIYFLRCSNNNIALDKYPDYIQVLGV